MWLSGRRDLQTLGLNMLTARDWIAVFTTITLLSCAGPALAQPVPTTPPLVAEQAIEFPEALASFTQALKDLDRLRSKAPRVRITHWGDSHIAADLLTAYLRRQLQKRFGNAGPGFAMVAKPWRSYRHRQLNYETSGRWSGRRFRLRYSRRSLPPPDANLGISAVATFGSRHARVLVSRRDKKNLPPCRIHILKRRRSGSVNLRAGRWRGRVIVPLKRKRLIQAKTPAAPWLEIRTTRSPVRFLGFDCSEKKGGIVYDALGINGAQADALSKVNTNVFKKQLQALAPNLMIVAYGSNEIDNRSLTEASYQQTFTQLLQQLKQGAPKSACLVVGPPDQARRNKSIPRSFPRSFYYDQPLPDGTLPEQTHPDWLVPDKLDWIVAVQRRVAQSQGCAFWDQRQALGGHSSIFGRVAQTPPLARRDHVHMTFAGYKDVAEKFYRALLSAAGFSVP